MIVKQLDRYPCRDINHGQPIGPDDAVWQQAAKARLVDVVTGKEPELDTFFQWLRDDIRGCLYLRFEGKAKERRSTFKLHDEPLWKQDVFELFICEGSMTDRYYELQSSPWDVRFDGRISYDEKGKRHLDVSWHAKGWLSDTSYDKRSGTLVSLWTLPYEAFEGRPQPGSSWRFGAFRIAGKALQSWQMTGEANFHMPQKFGYLDFE